MNAAQKFEKIEDMVNTIEGKVADFAEIVQKRLSKEENDQLTNIEVLLTDLNDFVVNG